MITYKEMIIYKDENDHSDHFRIIHYPDGQRNVVINPEMIDIKSGISIKCRIKSFSDLEILSCLINSLKRNDYFINDLDFYYLFGIRSDRAFTQYESSYFKEVVCPIINNWNIETIILRWPFTPLAILQGNLNNRCVAVIPFSKLYDDEYSEVPFSRLLLLPQLYDDRYLLGGDESVKHFEGVGIGKKFSKRRDTDGKLFNIGIEDLETSCDTILIVDDLCDGGATFIEEAKILRNRFPGKKLQLFIYHALFTKGVECLLEHFDRIYCTNSYQDISHPKIKQYKVI